MVTFVFVFWSFSALWFTVNVVEYKQALNFFFPWQNEDVFTGRGCLYVLYMSVRRSGFRISEPV